MTAKTTPTKKPTQKAEQSGTSLIGPNATIQINLTKAEVEKSYQRQLVKLAKQVKVAGFRQGKVPPKVAEEQLGQARIIESVLDELLPAAYQKTITEGKKIPITQPEFKIISADLGKDWVVEAEFAELPTIKLGNFSKYAKAGKKAAQQAKADQQKAANATKSDTKTTQKLTPEQEREQQLQYIFRELVTQIKPQIPQLLLKHETQHEFQHLAGQLKQLSIPVDDYLKNRNMTMEQLSQELAVQTLSRLQLDLILGAIAREQKISVNDQDRANYFAQIKDEKQREQLQKDTHYLSHLESNLIKQKVVDYLLTL